MKARALHNVFAAFNETVSAVHAYFLESQADRRSRLDLVLVCLCGLRTGMYAQQSVEINVAESLKHPESRAIDSIRMSFGCFATSQ